MKIVLYQVEKERKSYLLVKIIMITRHKIFPTVYCALFSTSSHADIIKIAFFMFHVSISSAVSMYANVYLTICNNLNGKLDFSCSWFNFFIDDLLYSK